MSVLSDDCLKYIVGLSRTDCTCDYYAECGDFDESESGLYIDELSPLNTVILEARADCEKGTLCTLMDRARANGIKIFKADLYGLILRTHTENRQRYNNAIGTKEYTQTRTLTNYAVNRFLMKDTVGGTFGVTRIWAGFDTTGIIPLFVYNNLNELVDTINISAVANTWTANDVTLSLPTHSDYIENLEYYFVYDSSFGNPFDNKLQYSDCNGVCYPDFQTMTNKQTGWAKWLRYYGTTKETLSFMDWDITGNEYMNGLIFDVDLKCDVSESICQTSLDFTSDPIALAMAEALRFRIGMELIDLIVSNPELERLSMINHDMMFQYRQEFKDEYKRLMYFDKRIHNTGAIERGLKIKNSDCFKCKDNWGFSKQGIFS